MTEPIFYVEKRLKKNLLHIILKLKSKIKLSNSLLEQKRKLFIIKRSIEILIKKPSYNKIYLVTNELFSVKLI